MAGWGGVEWREGNGGRGEQAATSGLVIAYHLPPSVVVSPSTSLYRTLPFPSLPFVLTFIDSHSHSHHIISFPFSSLPTPLLSSPLHGSLLSPLHASLPTAASTLPISHSTHTLSFHSILYTLIHTHPDPFSSPLRFSSPFCLLILSSNCNTLLQFPTCILVVTEVVLRVLFFNSSMSSPLLVLLIYPFTVSHVSVLHFNPNACTLPLSLIHVLLPCPCLCLHSQVSFPSSLSAFLPYTVASIFLQLVKHFVQTVAESQDCRIVCMNNLRYLLDITFKA